MPGRTPLSNAGLCETQLSPLGRLLDAHSSPSATHCAGRVLTLCMCTQIVVHATVVQTVEQRANCSTVLVFSACCVLVAEPRTAVRLLAYSITHVDRWRQRFGPKRDTSVCEGEHCVASERDMAGTLSAA